MQPDNVTTAHEEEGKGRPRLVLLGIVAIFLAPLLLAVFLNSRWTDWAPEATRNYGTLISPVVAVPEALRDELQLNEEWTLIVDPSVCGPECPDVVDRMHLLDRALGRHAGEVRQLVLSGDAPQAGAVSGSEWPDVDIVDLPIAWSPFLEEIEAADAGALLVDPLGNAMLAYPSQFDTGRVRKDLDRLLKYAKFKES